MAIDSIAVPAPQSDRIILRVEADSTDEELVEMADALVDWVKQTWARHHPEEPFFLPEEAEAGSA